jgi:hypothetical protein
MVPTGFLKLEAPWKRHSTMARTLSETEILTLSVAELRDMLNSGEVTSATLVTSF